MQLKDVVKAPISFSQGAMVIKKKQPSAKPNHHTKVDSLEAALTIHVHTYCLFTVACDINKLSKQSAVSKKFRLIQKICPFLSKSADKIHLQCSRWGKGRKGTKHCTPFQAE